MMIRTTARFSCPTCLNSYYSTVRFCSQLFVNRLSFYTTNEELERMFSPFGVVKEAKLIIEQRTQRPKGYGFVTFGTEAEAQRAVRALNGKIVRGRLIFVEFAKTNALPEDASSLS